MARVFLALAASLIATVAAAGAAAQDMPGMDHSAMPGMEHAAMPQPADAAMPGMAHDMAGMTMDMREASGTSWQPASSPMDAVHFSAGDWSLMAHGFVTGVYDDQGGGRGDTKVFSESMGMLMGTRPVGDGGTLGLRGMISLDPLMGKRGYPLLLATGETADGVTSLVDRQHPHDLLMELAATYSQSLGGGNAVSLYVAYPGEPALGPPTFMHRTSGIDNPEAPIGTTGSIRPTSPSASSPRAFRPRAGSWRDRCSRVRSPTSIAMASTIRGSTAGRCAPRGTRPTTFRCRPAPGI